MTNLFGVAARQGLCGAILKADTLVNGQAVSGICSRGGISRLVQIFCFRGWII